MDIIVEKEFQLKFILKFFLSAVAGFAIIVLSVYLTLPRGDVLHYYDAVLMFLKANEKLVYTFLIAGLIEFVFVAFSITVVSILASHKLAGPIFRLERTLESVAEGDLTHTIRFRNYDPFKDVARHFNDAVTEFVRRLKNINGAVNEFEQIRKAIDGTDESRRSLEKEISALEKELEEFKL